jgi:hypothetical protein
MGNDVKINMICSTRFTRYIFAGSGLVGIEWNLECVLLNSIRRCKQLCFFRFQFQFWFIHKRLTFIQNLKSEILSLRLDTFLKRRRWPKTHCLKKFRIYLATFSSFQIQVNANPCRETIKNLRCGCNFGIPQMLIISNGFYENPGRPRIFLVFFMASLCQWLQNKPIKISNIFFFMQPYLKEKSSVRALSKAHKITLKR